ncbi:MAG TPA: 5'-3' exonuclease H3TH domain-containing protein [Opitutaceae bacterium]
MAKWLLVDGFNLAYRCFFAIPELTRADGFPTNALHGWVKSIWRLSDQEKPDGILVFFDLGGSDERLALHPEYKANREEMPEALSKQVPVIKELTRAMGLAGIEIEGVESDDLLASHACSLARKGDEVLIVSSDKDFAQVVGPRIRVMLPPPTANPKLGWRYLDEAGVAEKFGVPPSKIADYLAIVGDTSDNIPGLAGVGPKTAGKWLAEFGSLEGVLLAADKVLPERFRPLVAESGERLRMNLRLTTLNLALPPPGTEHTTVHMQNLYGLLERMEMKGALAEAQKRYGQPELF